MSTQCGIAIKTDKGYETIDVHNDGYPGYMWPMLTKNYNTEELAAKLVSLGDASYIDVCLEPTAFSFHKFGTPEPDICMFYHRDRGDNWDDVAPTPYTKQELVNCYYYAYIWEDGCWKFYKGGKKVY